MFHQRHRCLNHHPERFLRQRPQFLTPQEQEQIRALASDLPVLWSSPATSDEDRKAILRQIIAKVVVQTEDDTEWFEAWIHWAGGQQTYSRLRRPVARLEQLSQGAQIRQRVLDLKQQGMRAYQIADHLNLAGLRATFGE